MAGDSSGRRRRLSWHRHPAAAAVLWTLPALALLGLGLLPALPTSADDVYSTSAALSTTAPGTSSAPEPVGAVLVDLPALESGEYEFRCGMNMVRGTIVVSAA